MYDVNLTTKKNPLLRVSVNNLIPILVSDTSINSSDEFKISVKK